MRLRLVRHVSACRAPNYLLLTLAILGAATACTRPARDKPSAAHTLLYQRLGRPAGFRAVGDSAFVVTEVENHRAPLTTAERLTGAEVLGKTILRNWPDPRVTSLTVNFQRISRFGPIVLGIDEYPVKVDLAAMRASGS